LFEGIIGGIKQIIDGIVKIFQGDFVGGLKDIFSGLRNILMAPFDALKEAIKTGFSRIGSFFSDAKKKLKEILGLQSEVEKNASKYKAGGGGYATGGGGSGGYGGGSSGGRAKGGIFYPSLLPKLAVGGIINNPGMGVAYNGAIIGERGAEAVVPLTDSQQMSLLGETIGRYITVNATIVNQMNGRVISKELQQIRNEEDFQFNG
jgi:hypothetical protein